MGCGEEESEEGGRGGLSVLVQHGYKHLTPSQLIRSAHLITEPHRLELIG